MFSLIHFVHNDVYICLYNFNVLPDPRGYHRVIFDRGVYRSAGSAWAPAEIHRTSDHHPDRDAHRSVWVPGCGGEGRKTLGHRYAVGSDFTQRNAHSGVQIRPNSDPHLGILVIPLCVQYILRIQMVVCGNIQEHTKYTDDLL